MKKILLLSSLVFLTASGCSTLFHRDNEEAPPQAATQQGQETDTTKSPATPATVAQVQRVEAQNNSLKNGLSELNAKIDALQSQIGELHQRLEVTRTQVDNLTSNQRAKPSGIAQHPTEGAVALPPAGDHAAEGSFSTDDPVQKYRQAMVFFQAQNYANAILAFSKFTDHYPDHALAGSAQYYLGECYFKQGDYKLAAKEFERVITSYDRSPHIAETLRDLAKSEDQTGQRESAERHRQLLNSLFPNSPAAIQDEGGAQAATEVPAEKTAANTPIPSVGAKMPAKEADPSALDSPPAAQAPATETAPQ